MNASEGANAPDNASEKNQSRGFCLVRTGKTLVNRGVLQRRTEGTRRGWGEGSPDRGDFGNLLIIELPAMGLVRWL